MKKAVSVLLCVLTFVFSVAPSFDAFEEEREYFDDGSYIVISDRFQGNSSSGDDSVSSEGESAPESGDINFLKFIRELIRKIIEFLKSRKTITETKYVSYYSSDGDCLWTAYITAEFTYNGKSSLCESVKTGSNIYDSDWKLLSKESAKDRNTASADFKVRQYKLGVPLKTIEKTITLTCDKDGNIK